MNVIDDELRNGFVVDHAVVVHLLQRAGLGGRCISNAPCWSTST